MFFQDILADSYPHLSSLPLSTPCPRWLHWCQSDLSELQIWSSNSFPCKLLTTTYRVKSNSLTLIAFTGCPAGFLSWAGTTSSWHNLFNGDKMQPSGSLGWLELRCPHAFVWAVITALNALSQTHLVGKSDSFSKHKPQP